ncbi:BlaI/MecI/CopY family transcriptional regulator, partial [Brevibacillus sp. SKDU10]|uniref:BlaI/MecI/CopY family transcriptional regulator n=1 Tax=Brevibacillus sp. SKDU10 TaxID=1247872 RepID=UPI000AFBC0C2
RLLKKKAIGYHKSGRSYAYYPLVSEKECRRAESESFLKRVFNGTAGMMITNFLEDADLSEKEINDLQKLLQDKQKKNT